MLVPFFGREIANICRAARPGEGDPAGYVLNGFLYRVYVTRAKNTRPALEKNTFQSRPCRTADDRTF